MTAPTPAALLAWYDAKARDLPWRRTRDPYRVLVSEVMLQQTRVATVLRYYDAFLAAFPDFVALAAAPDEALLARWAGLGYYRRARQLQAAARAIVAAGGEVPRDPLRLAELPGIGGYTAAAVASIAFGVPVPVLDGNVVRVAARLLGRDEVASAGARRELAARAGELLDPQRPGDSNQALMELGATVCSPRSPRCRECPLAADCRAFAEGRPEAYPRLRARPEAVDVAQVAAVTRDREGRLLMVRSERGLWELPVVEAGVDAAAALARRYGGLWDLAPAVATVRHSVTRYRLSVAVHPAKVVGGAEVAEGPEASWFAAAPAAVSALVRKVLAAEAANAAGCGSPAGGAR